MIENRGQEYISSQQSLGEPLRGYGEFSVYNSPLLTASSQHILGNADIPRKLQHRLLLLSLGMPIDRTQMHFPPDIFRAEASKIISEGRASGWLSLGISTALRSETGFKFATPTTKIKPDDNEQVVQEKVASLGNLQTGDYFVVYNNLWGDRANIVGGNLLYLSHPYNRESVVDDAYIIELQKGVWPRDIGQDADGLIHITKERLKHSPLMKLPKDYDGHDSVVERARASALRFAQDSTMRASIGNLMSIVGANQIGLNLQYYKGILTPLDFNS